MTPLTVIKHFDPFEQTLSGLGPGLEPDMVCVFGFQGKFNPAPLFASTEEAERLIASISSLPQ